MFSKTNNEVARLKGKKNIDALFSEGSRLVKHPIKLVCTKQLDDEFLFLGFNVSKHHFPHAVDRNKIKRLMREVFKKIRAKDHYSVFYGAGFFLYSGKEIPTIASLEKPMLFLIDQWRSLGKEA